MQKIGDITSSANAAGEFTEGNPAGGTAPTLIKAAWLNTLQRELIAVIEASGLLLDAGNDHQLIEAIRSLRQQGDETFAVDTGIENAYTAVYRPTVTAMKDGLQLRFRASNANSGPSTFAPDDCPPAPIVAASHSQLQGGEITKGTDVSLQWNGSHSNGYWVLLSNAGGALPVVKGKESGHAVTIGQVQEELRGSRSYVQSGTFTVPANVTTLYVSGCGGGGGGGGGGSNHIAGAAGSCGAGGGAGQSFIKTKISVVPGQVLEFSIGAPGVPGSGATTGANNATRGGDGGDTVLVGIFEVQGGKGGGLGLASAAQVPGGGYGGNGWPTGGSGSDGATGGTGNGWAGIAGPGASSLFGCGGSTQRCGIPGVSPVASGVAAQGYGSGGGGGPAAYNGVGAGGNGGAGTPGLLIFEW